MVENSPSLVTLLTQDLTVNLMNHHPGADFSYILSGENFGENSAENFPPKMLGKKIEFSTGKFFEKSFFQEIPRNFPWKVIFRGKNCTKNWPLVGFNLTPPN
jgi:hypothetical protein